MNNFSTLDAQSEICPLATVQSHELCADERPTFDATPIQLARWQRKAFAGVCKLPDTSDPITPEEKTVCANFRSRVVSIWEQIHAEVEPLRDALRRRDAELLAI